MKLTILLTLASISYAQSGNDKLSGLLQDRALYEAVARLKTDDRIAMYATLTGARPDDARGFSFSDGWNELLLM